MTVTAIDGKIRMETSPPSAAMIVLATLHHRHHHRRHQNHLLQSFVSSCSLLLVNGPRVGIGGERCVLLIHLVSTSLAHGPDIVVG